MVLCAVAIGCSSDGGGDGTSGDASTEGDTASREDTGSTDVEASIDAGADAVADVAADAPPASGPTLAGCPMFPADNPWNRDVSADPVDAQSTSYIAAMAPAKAVHPDWGASPYGIPWVTVPATQPKVPVSFTYDDESDPGPYPIPPDAPIEGGAGATGDRHVLVLQRDTCKLYELFAAVKSGSGWQAGSGAVFDLRSNALRPEGWTSADAAGLPVLPGLVRFDEVKAGKIAHAVRFTMVNTQRAYIHPATHWASTKTDPALPPMGLRVRLRASFDASTFSAPGKVVVAAMKTYGMLLADNGSDWFVTGDTHAGWDGEVSAGTTYMDALLADLRKVKGSDFEVVKTGTIYK